jgi:hypothetical protein
MNFSVSVPEPCPVKWDSMQARENGKYCGTCDKVVVDFANKTNEEIIDYLNSEKGKNSCGSFLKGQLEPKTIPQPVSNKKNVRIFLAALYFVFGGFLFLSNKADAQVTTERYGGVPAITYDDDDLYLKYPQGITETIQIESNDTVTKRIVVVGKKGWIYTRKKYAWGTYYFKDDMQITAATFDKETSPAYVKGMLEQPTGKDEREGNYNDSLCKKYPQGLTEMTELDKQDSVLTRIVIVGNQGWVYKRRKYSWGGTFYFKDGLQISENSFDYETSPAHIKELLQNEDARKKMNSDSEKK